MAELRREAMLSTRYDIKRIDRQAAYTCPRCRVVSCIYVFAERGGAKESHAEGSGSPGMRMAFETGERVIRSTYLDRRDCLFFERCGRRYETDIPGYLYRRYVHALPNSTEPARNDKVVETRGRTINSLLGKMRPRRIAYSTIVL